MNPVIPITILGTMPSQAPRSDTSKKRVQLLVRQHALEKAIQTEPPSQKLLKVAELFRAAQLSLLKAQRHWAFESQIRRLPTYSNSTRDFGDIAKIEDAMRVWINKPVDEIISECRKSAGGTVL